MLPTTSSCLPELDYNHLAFIAYQRYVEGVQTIELLEQAESEREKEEIALVALLEVEADLCLELQHHYQDAEIWLISDFKRAMKLSIQCIHSKGFFNQSIGQAARC